MTEQQETQLARDPGEGFSRSSALRDRYAKHNLARGRGFVYGGNQRVEQMRQMIPPEPGDVLDLGCRDGIMAQALSLTQSFVAGLDIDVDTLLIAREVGVASCCADL